MKTLKIILNNLAKSYAGEIIIQEFQKSQFPWQTFLPEQDYLYLLLGESIIVMTIYDDEVPMASAKNNGKYIFFSSLHEDEEMCVLFFSLNQLNKALAQKICKPFFVADDFTDNVFIKNFARQKPGALDHPDLFCFKGYMLSEILMKKFVFHVAEDLVPSNMKLK
jgi:hypothetical protein